MVLASTINSLVASSHAAWIDGQIEPCHAATLVPLTSAQIWRARSWCLDAGGCNVIAAEVE